MRKYLSQSGLRAFVWLVMTGLALTQNTMAETESTPTVAAPPESVDILEREPQTEKAEVRHVLIGWGELEPAYGDRMDERGKARSAVDARDLVLQLFQRALDGEDFIAMMKTYSEDWGSADTGMAYTATPDAGLVDPFKRLSLRLAVKETGLVRTKFGWHIIKRFE